MIRTTSIALILISGLAPLSCAELAAEEKTPDGFPLPSGAIHRFGNRQLRHPDGILSSAISPDGNYLLTASPNACVVWDLKTLNVKCIINGAYFAGYGYGDRSGGHAFLPDSKSVVVTLRPPARTPNPTSKVEIAQVWDLETGKAKFGLKGSWSYSVSTWLVNDGKEIVVQGGNGNEAQIHFFDSKEGKILRTVDSAPMNRGYWISPNGSRVAIPHVNTNTGIIIVDVLTGKQVDEVTNERLIQAAFSPDGNKIIYHEATGKVKLFDIETKKEVLSFTHPAEQQRGPMRFSKDQQTLYFGGQHGQLYRWDLKNNKQLPDVGRHSSWTLTSIALSPDESILYSMGGDRLIRRWDVKTGKEIPLPEGYITQTATVPSVDGKSLIVADHAGAIDYWDIASGKRIKRVQEQKTGGIDWVATSADGQWLASGRTVQDVQLWDLKQGKLVRTIPLVEKPDEKGGDHVKRVAFSPNGKILYTGSAKTGVSAWEVPSGKKLWNTPELGHLIAVDPKGRWVATGCGFPQPPIRWTLLDATTGQIVRAVDLGDANRADPDGNVDPSYITELASTPDGSRVVSTHYYGTLGIWDPATGKELSRTRGITQGNTCLAISPDGHWLGIGRPDRKISIYELASAKEVLVLAPHDSQVRDVVFTRDGRSIIGNADLAPLSWSLEPAGLPSLERTSNDLWNELASEDGAKAYKLQWALSKKPAVVVKLFQEFVNPEELTIDREKFDQWVSALDSPLFRAREVAERDITRAGMKIPIAWLRTAMEKAKGDESPARLKRVLAIRDKPDPTEWRLKRAVQILELAGTEETKAMLKAWATSGGSTLAEDAKAALNRLP